MNIKHIPFDTVLQAVTMLWGAPQPEELAPDECHHLAVRICGLSPSIAGPRLWERLDDIDIHDIVDYPYAPDAMILTVSMLAEPSLVERLPRAVGAVLETVDPRWRERIGHAPDDVLGAVDWLVDIAAEHFVDMSKHRANMSDIISEYRRVAEAALAGMSTELWKTPIPRP